jgi:hypothetical protein
MEEQLDILDIYLKLYDEKNYRNTFYNLTYSNMIQHFIDYKIYDYDAELIADGFREEQICHFGFAFEGKHVLIG